MNKKTMTASHQATEPLLRIVLAELPPASYGANQSRGAHWGRQYRDSHGKRGAVEHVVVLVREQGWNRPPLEKARVKVTFGLPDKRRRDATGLIERVKPYLDGLTSKPDKNGVVHGASVIVDDDLECIGFPDFGWFSSPRVPVTIISVEEAPDAK